MEKHLLLTVSSDASALYGVRFLSSFFQRKQDIRLTLFYTASMPPTDKDMIEGGELYLLRKKQAEDDAETGRLAMEHARDLLCEKGFRCDVLSLRLKEKHFSTAQDIISEAEEGLYDALVLGRRGLGWLEAALDRSISAEVFKLKFTTPCWICRQPEMGRSNVLLCVDGSEQSLRIADHVGFILADQPGHEVVLFHVQNGHENMDLDLLFGGAEQELLNNGFPAKLIKRKIVRESSVARAVLREVDAGRYAVAAMGRTGSGGSLMRKILLGSTSSVLFRELSGAVLWVSY